MTLRAEIFDLDQLERINADSYKKLQNSGGAHAINVSPLSSEPAAKQDYSPRQHPSHSLHLVEITQRSSGPHPEGHWEGHTLNMSNIDSLTVKHLDIGLRQLNKMQHSHLRGEPPETYGKSSRNGRYSYAGRGPR